ncbi:MAG: MarR family winged helix-turn-helix transcriptional regulator [Polyangiaceae bacterium]|nr:MarR family winged helix-turn-helix transcriptional regulator [Polyangiaceae bacterium]
MRTSRGAIKKPVSTSAKRHAKRVPRLEEPRLAAQVNSARVRSEIQTSTAQLLLQCARLWDERATAIVSAEAGQIVLRPAHTKLFPHIALEGGTRIGVLAQKLGVTKQAVSQLVDDLVQVGVLEVVADKEDGRAKCARLTPKGFAAISHGLGVLGGIESALVERVGATPLADLRRALTAILPALEAMANEPLKS